MKYPHELDTARRLLAEIGLRDTDNDGFVEDAEGHTVELNLLVNGNNSLRVNTATIIAANLKEAGINAKIQAVPFTELLSRTDTTFDFEAVISGWQSGTPPGPSNTKNVLLSAGAQHVCFPRQAAPSSEWEARIDQLVYELDAAPTEEDRVRIYHELQRIWSEQLAEINLVAEHAAVAYKSSLANIKPSSLFAHLTWNCEEIYVK
jgi:peptide/nickel transport system substrate-binding protein